MHKYLYLGQKYVDKKPSREHLTLDTEDLLTHCFVCGATGSGKTVLGKIMIEEAALVGIPSILIDLKGDLSSLAIPLTNLDKSEIEPWVEARNAEERSSKATQLLKYHKQNLIRSELLIDDIQRFRRQVDVRIYTPKSRLGTPLSISPLSRPACDVRELYESERDIYVNLVGNVAQSIFERIFIEEERLRMVEELTYLEEAISHLWMKGANLDGKKGFVELIRAVFTPPMEKIGVMKPADFLSDERRRQMARRLNRLLVGSESLWYEGEPFPVVLDSLTRSGGKTQVVILNFAHLESFEERSLVLSQVAYTIYSWMRKKIEWSGPRLLFYVDEIGGGGRYSFFPDEPHQNTSKTALNLLLRQGRAFGVCCVFSTQNPGDIDYRGLTNCQTWFIGKLLTESDRAKILQGLAGVNFLVKQFEEFVKTAEAGDFAVKFRGGDTFNFRERWLLTYHKVMTPDDFPVLKARLHFEECAAQAEAQVRLGRPVEALRFVEAKLSEAGSDPDLLLLKADIAREAGAHDVARASYEETLRLRPTDTACLKFGTLLHAGGNHAGAIAIFRRGIEINPANEYLLTELGRTLEAAGEVEEADQSYQIATKINMNLEEAWCLRGWLQLGRRDGHEAAHCFTRALDVRPESVDSRTGFAVANHLLGQTVAALDELAAVLTVNPAHRRALREKSLIHAEIGEFDEAAAASAAIVKLDDSDSRAWLEHAWILARGGLHRDATLAFRTTVKLKSDCWEAWDGLAVSMLELGDAANALIAARNATQLHRRDPFVLYHLATAQRRAGGTEEELKILEEIAREFPTHVPAWLDLTDHLVHDRKFDEGLLLIDRALKSNVGDERLLYKKAATLHQTGNAKEALRILSVVKELDRTAPEVLLLKASVLAANDREMDALEALKQATQFFPDRMEPLRERGRLFAGMKKFREAAEVYEQALKLDAGDAAMWTARGESLKAMFEENEAEKCFVRAKALGGSAK